jgi:hypothetical protein
MYARVNELEFHYIYCQPLLLVEFPLYTQPCKAIHKDEKHERKMLTPSIPFKPQTFARDNGKESKLDTSIKEMVEQQVRDNILKGSTKIMCERNDKAYYKANTRMSTEHPHSLQ